MNEALAELQLFYQRYTARAFKPDPVPDQLIRQVFEAAGRAPSWANSQPWEVFIAKGQALERLRQAYQDRFDKGVCPAFEVPRPEKWPPALEARIRDLIESRQRFLGLDPADPNARRELQRRNYCFFGAPVVAFLCMDRQLGLWGMFDLGGYACAVALAGRAAGLDSAIAVNFVAYPDLVRAELGIPEDLLLVIGIALGYADMTEETNKFRSRRRDLNDVVRICE